MKQLARKGGEIEMGVYCQKKKNGTVSWYIQYVFEGKRITEKVPALTQRDALQCLGKRRAEILEGRFYHIPTVNDITIAEWAEEYTEIKTNQGLRSMRRVNQVVKVIKKHLGKFKMRELKPSHVEAFKAKLLRTKSQKAKDNNLTPGTVNRHLAQLKNMYNVAIKEGLVQLNPVSSVKFEKEHNSRKRVISSEEFKELLSKCPEPLYGMVLMAWETGMRRSEITNLTWNQINLETRLINLPPQMTKTNEPRTIPISPRLHEYLSNLPRGLKSKRVFLYKGNGLQEFKRSWATAKTEAKIENLWFHDFRRCFITRMRRLGVDFYTVRAITGHKTLAAFSCYQAIEEKDLVDAVTKLSAADKLQMEGKEPSPTDQVGENSSIKSNSS